MPHSKSPLPTWQKWARYVVLGAPVLMAAPFLLGQDGPVNAERPLTSQRSEVTRRGIVETQSIPVTEPTPLQSAAAAKEEDFRMLYLNTPWPKVLQDVAEKCGYQLVIHDLPQGNFNRQDFRKHSKTDAIRILNQSLEPMGYRVLITGQFMSVLGIERSRVEYPRREFAQPTQPLGQNPVAPAERPLTTNAPATFNLPNPGPANQPRTIAEATRSATPLDTGRNAFVYDPAVMPAQFEAGGQPLTVQAEDQMPEVTRKIMPTRRTAADLARQLHKAFQQRATIVNQGPHGLPAIKVAPPEAGPLLGDNPMESAAPGGPTFLLELDVANNTLWLQATEPTANSLERLILLLDRTVVGPGESERIVAGSDMAAEVAEKLNPELEKLQQLRKQNGGNQAVPGLAQGGQPPLLGDPANPPSPLQGGGMSDMNLKGDVYLEAMQDLDLLILRGNEADIEKVMAMIQQIESMAVGTAPDVHLLTLQYVNSESLAELLADVYERLTELQTRGSSQARKSVDIVAVSRPNAILVMAPETVMESILTLARELDQPIDPSTEVQVFALKNAVASQVVTVLEDFFEERAGLGTRVKVTADVRTNSVIVQAKPGELSEVELIIKRMDRGDSSSRIEMKPIQLKHAAADELATFLNTALQSLLNPPTTTTAQGGGGGGFGGNQSAQELRDSRAVVLEFLTSGGNAERLLRSGLLSDIRINGDIRTNTLLVTAPKSSIPLLEELIRVLDQPSAAVSDIKIFPLKNADAQATVDVLTELFAAQTNQQSQQELGIQLAGATDSSSSLVPLRFQADVRTNMVIAVGGNDALRMVEAVIFKLDQGYSRDRQKTVIKLRNSSAQDVATAITQFLQGERDLYQIDPNRVSTSQLLEQEVIVTPEVASNTLLISATPKYFDMIKKLADDLDREPAQVMIQALLVEVQLTDNDEFGVELGFQDDVLFDRGLIDSVQSITETTTAPNGVQTTTQRILSQSSNPGFPFNNLPLGNNTAINPNAVGSQGLSSFGLGRVSSDLGFGGLVLSASSENVNVLIRALAARRNVRVLSRPQILALDNQTAQIQVGQSVPILLGVTQTNAGTTNNIDYADAGIILTVAPRISPEGQVVMEVTAEKSSFTTGVDFVTAGANGNNTTTNSPIKNVTTAQTSVKVPDGQTIVVGGMISESTESNERKVPWLGDLPLIGSAFRYDSSSHERSELLIFLTPRIIHVDSDMEFLKQVEAGRIQFFHDEAEQVHGPLFGLPEQQYYDNGFIPSDATMQGEIALPPPPAGLMPVPTPAN